MDRELEMAQVRLNLGSAYLAVGELDKAEPILAAARTQLDGLEDMEESRVQVALGLGRLAFQRSDFTTSLQQFEEAVEIAVKAFGRGVPRTAEAMYELGSTRFQTGDHLGAIPMLETAREVRVELLGESASDSLLAGLFLTLSHAAAGNLDTQSCKALPGMRAPSTTSFSISQILCSRASTTDASTGRSRPSLRN